MLEVKVPRDTHLLLWAAGGSDRLPAAARPLLEDLQNELLLSPANLWEIATKTGRDRPNFRANPPIVRCGLIDNGDRPL
jgi:PIN domain nuclease of toxin-antitoxin system